MKSTIRVSKPPSGAGFGLNSHQSDSKSRALGHQALLALCEASPRGWARGQGLLFSEEVRLKTEAKSRAQQPNPDSQLQQDMDRRSGDSTEGIPSKTAGARFTVRPSPMTARASSGPTQGLRNSHSDRRAFAACQALC